MEDTGEDDTAVLINEDEQTSSAIPSEKQSTQTRWKPRLFAGLLACSACIGLLALSLKGDEQRAVGSSGKAPGPWSNPASEPWKTRLSSVRKNLIEEPMAFHMAMLEFDFEQIGKTETESGYFETWAFPLMFSNHTIYVRRFGVDMPRECLWIQCPLVVDFHGSYDSLFSQRAWTEWYKYQANTTKKFVLLTPEGSPDAISKPGAILNDCNTTDDNCTGSSLTSWNVLGWGTPTDPVEHDESCTAGDNAEGPDPVCFWSTLKPENAYQCFATQLELDPKVCEHSGRWMMPINPAKCQSASSANDEDYMKQVMEFLVPHYNVDIERIYLTGQSMGGMSSLQWAMHSGTYDLGKYRPAAIAPCSAGAARAHLAKLDAQVPTLLMWGYEDSVAPPTVWAGYDRDNEYLPTSAAFETLILDTKLQEQALRVTGKMPQNNCSSDVCEDDICCLMLWANTLTGGDLLKQSKLQESLFWRRKLGCYNHEMKEMTSLDGSAFMWEGVKTTLREVVGNASLDFRDLHFQAPDTDIVPEQFQLANDILCAKVPNKNDADIRVCIFQGGHSYPWKDHDTNDWIAGGGEVFHDFVWKGFLKEGEVKRS